MLGCCLLLLMLMSVQGYAQCCEKSDGSAPAQGFVPNKQAAIQVAEAVLTPIYGLEVVKTQRPFRVELVKGVWEVKGKMPKSSGGNAIVRISKKNGCILFVTFTE
jgi:hypothetical protein